MGDYQRHIRLQGARNLRDIGGYQTVDGRQTRWRVVLRSGCLDRLSLDGQNWLVNLGLRTVIDLRDNAELAEAPDVFARSDLVRYRHVPLFDSPLPANVLPPSLTEGYRRILFERAPRVRMVFEELLQPGALPALIHCAVGKDRTGVIVAMLLGAVGVPAETIVEDYALSSKCLGPDLLPEARAYAEQQGWPWELTAAQWTCPPELMRRMLDEVHERYASVSDYLRSIGLESHQLARLRTLLLSSNQG